MKTKAVRMYGKKDLRLETFELPEIGEGEILAEIVSDSLCMSSYKAAVQGEDHKRVPKDIAVNPTIIGHECCGVIKEVGSKWADRYQAGMKFSIQPALNLPENVYAAPGYSFKYIGGNATYIVIPEEVMEQDCLLEYKGDAFYFGSLAEPMSCIVGAFNASYHSVKGTYEHKMGIKEGGKMAILAGVGPMGLGAIDLAIHGDRKPSLLVVTDIDDARLERAAGIYTVEEAKRNGVELVYLNTGVTEVPVEAMLEVTGGSGFDDVLVMAPVKSVLEQASGILGFDGCLNFFAGPTNKAFAAQLNYYDVHYNETHIVGTSGGNTEDMRQSLKMMAEGRLNPSAMITHIGGLNAAVDTTLRLPEIPGGKKLIYTDIEMPLVAIEDFEQLGQTDSLYAKLAEIVARHGGLWNGEAEAYLLIGGKFED